MKKKIKIILLVGIILLEMLAVGFDAMFNNSRIIQPIDSATYEFRMTDIPLIGATGILVVYVLFVVFGFVYYNIKNNVSASNRNKTRVINPRWGWMGFFGFFGLLGIPIYMKQHQVWPFFFFVFFGFFGFFYEGKLSQTLMDERFEEERRKADLSSYKAGFVLLWVVTWLIGMMNNRLTADAVAIIFMTASSLIIALVLFMKSYLLYRYDREEVE